ncbi:MAG: polysaccharide pyruvyl transferase family protein [Candidatus Nomurabacteria bacterium]|jgi:hypothetical protein|nr:polysaccharide pyruvyl transferase family protein [Candidatus Nomurabacteria bacterium]
MSKMASLCAFTTCNDGYVEKSVAALKSVRQHNKTPLYIIGKKFSVKSIDLMQKNNIEPIEVDLKEHFHKAWDYPIECYYIFAGPEILSKLGFSHSLYIDGDIYCNKKLKIDGGVGSIDTYAGVAKASIYDILTFERPNDIQKILKRWPRAKKFIYHKRIHSGVVIFNNDYLTKFGFLKKVSKLYKESIKIKAPRKGDDSLLSLFQAVYRIEPKYLPVAYNFFERKPVVEGKRWFFDHAKLKGKIIFYHFIKTKPWSDDRQTNILAEYFSRKFMFMLDKRIVRFFRLLRIIACIDLIIILLDVYLALKWVAFIMLNLFRKLVCRKYVWLIFNDGADSEKFFNFVQKQHNRAIKVFLAERKATSEKSSGDKIIVGSFKYKVLCLSADRIISQDQRFLSGLSQRRWNRFCRPVHDNLYIKNNSESCLGYYNSLLNSDMQKYIKKMTNNKARFFFKRLSNYGKRPISTWWWRYNTMYFMNFGDEMTRYIISSIFGRKCEWAPSESCELVGAGSILHNFGSEGSEVHVWGSGYKIPSSTGGGSANSRFIVHAIRGKLSAKLAHVKKAALGDPGLLVNLVFRKAPRKAYKVGIVCHISNKDSKYLNGVQRRHDYLVINPLQTPDKVAYDITSCKLILSSSLHGIIFADSFNIPCYWMPLSSTLDDMASVKDSDFKFHDYYSSTGRRAKKIPASVIGDEKAIERMIKRYVPIKNLKQIQKDLIKSFPSL